MRLLLAEDEKEMSAALSAILTHSGYDVDAVYDGQAAVEKALSQSYDCMIFDIMMPKKDGVQALKEIRDKGNMTPVIMLTAKGETADRVSGLEMGADDYIVKPLEMPEVIARVRAVFRRMAPDDAPEKLSFDNLVIDKQAYDLVIKGKRVDAPPKEIELLYFLASSPNRVFTRAQLLDDVWGFDYFGDTRTVDVHVKRLREKLEGVSDKWELKTVWGVGYKFETKE